MSDYEQWVLDGLALNDATWGLESISDPPAAMKPEWISGADSDGALLGRAPKYENKIIEMQLRVVKQSTMDLANAKIAALLDKLQECKRNANGLALVWTPADATTSAITWRCLLGEIVNLPKDWQDSGYFRYTPVVNVRLTCSPLGLGTETLLGTVTSTDPMQVLELSGVTGDEDALGRLVVTDNASQSRRYVAWGLESFWLPTSSPPSLILDSTSMVTSGYAGATGTRTGAYSGASNNVISATLRTQVQAICGLGNLSHVGEFRPHLRFYASATTMAVRLTFQSLDGPFRSLSYRVPVVAGWNLLDLGLINVPQAVLGTQRWTGRIEAYSTATGGETLDIDVLLLVPAERFGRVTAPHTYAPGVSVAIDEFTAMTAATALNARVAPLGGTWATSGVATDFAAYDFTSGEEAVSRSTITDAGAPRYAILGSTNYTASEVAVDVSATGGIQAGVIARWTDANNYALLLLTGQPDGGTEWDLTLVKRVGGSLTSIASTTGPGQFGAWYQLRLLAYATGRMVATWSNAAGGTIASLDATDTAIATGGTLATGKPGIFDLGFATTAARYYDNFYAATPAAEPIALYSGQSLEIRHDSALRKDATGVYAGTPPQYIGSRFLVPNAGGPARETRIAVIARRNNVMTMPDDQIADSTTVAAYGTPRYLAVPR